MKVLIVLLAVCAVAYCDTTCSAASPNLEDEIKKFEALIPLEEIKKIALNYIANDEQVQEILSYLQGKDFAKIVAMVEEQKEVIDLYKFLCANGVNIYKFLNNLHDLLGLPHVTPAPSRDAEPSTRTFRQFLDDMEKVIPIDKLKALFIQEKKDSSIFKELVNKISSKEFRAMVDKMIMEPEVKEFRAKLVKLGADIDKLENFVRELMGWSAFRA